MWSTTNHHQARKQDISNISRTSASPKSISKSKYKSNYAKSHKKQSNHSATPTNKENIQERYGVKLVKKLENHREKLCKKLEMYTILFSTQGVNKCLRHDCAISAYDSKAKQLLCAACLTGQIAPASSQFNKQKSSRQSTNILNKNTNSAKFTCLPLQKSTVQLQSNISELKLGIIKQLQTLKQIENILYTGFQEERVELQFGIRNVENLFDQVIQDLNQAKAQAKCMLIDKYSQEKIKHEFVIKQLGLLRLLAQQYLQKLNKNQQQSMNISSLTVAKLHVKEQSPYKQLNKSRTQNSMIISLHQIPTSSSNNNEHQWPSNSFQMANCDPKALVYQHLVFEQLVESLRFSKSGHSWTRQKHVNNIQVRVKELVQTLKNVRNFIKFQFNDL